MPISKETKERIAQDGRKHWLNTSGDQGELDYIAGGEAEAERAFDLLLKLETIKAITESPVMPSFTLLKQLCRIATEALANYNSKPVK